MKNPTLKETLLQRIEEFPLYVEMKLKYDKYDKIITRIDETNIIKDTNYITCYIVSNIHTHS